MKDVEARVLPVSVAVLMIAVALSAVFVLMPGNNVIVKAYPDSYSDDFEDDVVGNAPSDSWYTFYVESTPDVPYECNITDDYAIDSNSFNFTYDADGSGSKLKVDFNFASPSNYTYFNFSFYPLTGHNYARIYPYSDTEYTGIIYLGYQGTEEDDHVYFKYGSSATYDLGTYTYNAWNNISIQFNYSVDDGTMGVKLDSGSGWGSWVWHAFYDVATINTLTHIAFNGGISDSYNTNIRYDNFVLEHTGATGGGTEEQCYYNVTGLQGSDKNVTFGSGEAGDTLYSNATGNWGAGAMMDIEISTNASVNVTDILLDFAETDLDTTVHWENISISVDLNNASWHSFALLTSVDQGVDLSNVSLDTSWSSICSDANPFPISNSTVGVDDHIYIRFKIELPSDAATGTYTTNAWNVLWKTENV